MITCHVLWRSWAPVPSPYPNALAFQYSSVSLSLCVPALDKDLHYILFFTQQQHNCLSCWCGTGIESEPDYEGDLCFALAVLSQNIVCNLFFLYLSRNCMGNKSPRQKQHLLLYKMNTLSTSSCRVFAVAQAQARPLFSCLAKYYDLAVC